METSFKASKKSNYFQIDYISGLTDMAVQYHMYVWCLSKAHSRDFIQRVKEIETHVKEKLTNDGLSYDFRLIMHLYLNVIENISCGLDIRSTMTSHELAERFVSGYHRKYLEAQTFCKDTLEYVESVGKKDSYMKDWRRYDKHNDLVREFRLPMKKLELSDFHVDHLDNMAKSLDMLNNFINERKALKNGE